MAPWRLLQSAPASAAENMAADEALLELGREITSPVLRFYSWSEPAASFGFFQKFRDVQRMTPLRPLVRRPTGGGVVPHDHDWTYSLVFPPSTDWYGLRAMKSYENIHAWVSAAFSKLGVQSTLAVERQRSAVGECFAGAEQFDVVAQGRKIAGAAQRRNKSGLLIQGSVQPPSGVERREWESALCEIATTQWDVEWKPFEALPDWKGRVRELVEIKYSCAEYNERR